jgi:hypothetical protein
LAVADIVTQASGTAKRLALMLKAMIKATDAG